MTVKTKIIIILILLALIDTVIPFPIIGVVCVYIVLAKPMWFRNMVKELYEERGDNR